MYLFLINSLNTFQCVCLSVFLSVFLEKTHPVFIHKGAVFLLMWGSTCTLSTANFCVYALLPIADKKGMLQPELPMLSVLLPFTPHGFCSHQEQRIDGILLTSLSAENPAHFFARCTQLKYENVTYQNS